jgi:MFS superfamily sulfate permease-like transporter
MAEDALRQTAKEESNQGQAVKPGHHDLKATGSWLSVDSDSNDDEHSERHHSEKPRSIVNAMASATINFLLMFGLCCAYGMIMFAADHNAQHRALGVKMNLGSAFVTGLALSSFSRVPVAIGGPDLNPVVFLGGFVDVIAEHIAKDNNLQYPDASGRRLSDWRLLGGSSSSGVEFCIGQHLADHLSDCEAYHEELRATTIFSVAISSALLGFCYFTLGKLHLTRVVRYLPSSIMEAFLSCIGYKVFKYALEFSNYEARQFVPAACVGVPLYFMKAMHIGNPAVVLPIGLLVPVGIFYGAMYAYDADFDPIKDQKVMFPEMPNVDFWTIWTDSIGKADKINFNAWSYTGPDLAIMVVVCLLDCVLKISSTEEKLPIEVDKDYEICLYGATNALTTACGSSVGYMQLKFNVINYGICGNITDRRAGAIYACMCGACFFGTIYFFNYLPRFFLTALLFFAGSGFVAENLWGSRKFLSFLEWLEILIILAVFIFSGKLLYAVAAGVLLCGFSFVHKYASVPVLCGLPCSGRDVDTRERRNPLVQRTVNHISGTWLLILRLKGFVFFGSASTVTAYVMHRIKEDEDDEVPHYRRLKYVCFDCEYLDGLDASAGKALSRLVKDCAKHNIEFIWSHLSEQVRKDLKKREILGFDESDCDIKWFNDLNAAVLHVENYALDYQHSLQKKWLSLSPAFLHSHTVRQAQVAFEPFRHVFLFDGPRVGCPWCYCQGTDLQKRTVLWHSDRPSTSLYLIHTGAVGIFQDIPTTVAEWKTPTAVYRHGWFLNVEALANAPVRTCAIALENTQVVSWSVDQWRVMAREQPLMMAETMRALLKQQYYDDHANERTADNLHMDMDNHDWEAFEDLVDHHAHVNTSMDLEPDVSGLATPPSVRKSVVNGLNWIGSLALHADSKMFGGQPRTPLGLPSRQTSRESDLGVKRAGDWGHSPNESQMGRPGRPSRPSTEYDSRDVFSTGVAYLPHELQIRVPALQTAQALGKLGFYESAKPETLMSVPLPEELLNDLRISFLTFSDGSLLEKESVRSALMYAGIFEEPPELDALAASLNEEDFIALCTTMLVDKLDEAHVYTTKQMFLKYDVDDSGNLDISELSQCFQETIHPKVSAEEV